MTTEHDHMTDPKMQAAVAELQELIQSHYPTAMFTVGEAEGPDGVYMRAIVDGEDTDEVTEVFIDRMIDLQVEDGLPLYVVPVRTPERSAALRQQHLEARAVSVLPI